MRAISLWQPWASAVALGSKTIETRHWSTNYRGPLAIHAAKKFTLAEMIRIGSTWQWKGALRPYLNDRTYPKLEKDLPFGALVAVAHLVDCRYTDSFTLGEIREMRRPDGETSDIYNWTEEYMGDFSLGRFGWVLRDIKPLATPIPYKGAQGFFNVPDELLREAA